MIVVKIIEPLFNHFDYNYSDYNLDKMRFNG
jgi:hypothetical protein